MKLQLLSHHIHHLQVLIWFVVTFSALAGAGFLNHPLYSWDIIMEHQLGRFMGYCSPLLTIFIDLWYFIVHHHRSMVNYWTTNIGRFMGFIRDFSLDIPPSYPCHMHWLHCCSWWGSLKHRPHPRRSWNPWVLGSVFRKFHIYHRPKVKNKAILDPIAEYV